MWPARVRDTTATLKEKTKTDLVHSSFKLTPQLTITMTEITCAYRDIGGECR